MKAGAHLSGADEPEDFKEEDEGFKSEVSNQRTRFNKITGVVEVAEPKDKIIDGIFDAPAER